VGQSFIKIGFFYFNSGGMQNELTWRCNSRQCW